MYDEIEVVYKLYPLLTFTQKKIFILIARRMTRAEVARKLGVSRANITQTVARIRRKAMGLTKPRQGAIV